MQDAALLGELEALQAGARDRVVHLNEASFARYASGARRPYHLVVFLTASHLLDKPQLGLRELRAEFGLLAQARHTTARLGSEGITNPNTLKGTGQAAARPVRAALRVRPAGAGARKDCQAGVWGECKSRTLATSCIGACWPRRAAAHDCQAMAALCAAGQARQRIGYVWHCLQGRCQPPMWLSRITL